MNGAVLLAVAVPAGALVWAVDVAINPKAPCRSCDGKGRHWLSRAKAYGDCRACGGTGRRLRFGAQWVRPGLRRK